MQDLLCIMQGYCGQDQHTIRGLLRGLYQQNHVTADGGFKQSFNFTPDPLGRTDALAMSAFVKSNSANFDQNDYNTENTPQVNDEPHPGRN